MGCGATTGTSGNCEQVVAGCGELWRVVGELWQARINGETHTPHGRGHITGYVKHFCSFYVDITGDNP